MKTIISANVSVSVAKRLQGKTKGTRSRVIERALKNYLDEKDAFDMWEFDILDVLFHIAARPELTRSQTELIHTIIVELKE
jgi:metal-responsive CopG/Arc/MetJ family transcriptional regulator